MTSIWGPDRRGEHVGSAGSAVPCCHQALATWTPTCMLKAANEQMRGESGAPPRFRRRGTLENDDDHLPAGALRLKVAS